MGKDIPRSCWILARQRQQKRHAWDRQGFRALPFHHPSPSSENVVTLKMSYEALLDQRKPSVGVSVKIRFRSLAGTRAERQRNMTENKGGLAATQPYWRLSDISLGLFLGRNSRCAQSRGPSQVPGYPHKQCPGARRGARGCQACFPWSSSSGCLVDSSSNSLPWTAPPAP